MRLPSNRVSPAPLIYRPMGCTPPAVRVGGARHQQACQASSSPSGGMGRPRACPIHGPSRARECSAPFEERSICTRVAIAVRCRSTSAIPPACNEYHLRALRLVRTIPARTPFSSNGSVYELRAASTTQGIGSSGVSEPNIDLRAQQNHIRPFAGGRIETINDLIASIDLCSIMCPPTGGFPAIPHPGMSAPPTQALTRAVLPAQVLAERPSSFHAQDHAR